MAVVVMLAWYAASAHAWVCVQVTNTTRMAYCLVSYALHVCAGIRFLWDVGLSTLQMPVQVLPLTCRTGTTQL